MARNKVQFQKGVSRTILSNSTVPKTNASMRFMLGGGPKGSSVRPVVTTSAAS